MLNSDINHKYKIMQEMSILKQCAHKNIVRLYDTFETDKHLCFVMELCQAGDLLTYVRKRRKLKENNAKFLFKMLVTGLKYLHENKFVVHRDIKLDNILID
jgi:serine/threonine protein kinase